MSARNTWLALVALADDSMPLPQDVIEELAQRYPEAPPLTVASETDSSINFAWGDATLNITLVPRPIPWSQIEGPCAIAWYWPEAESEMRAHKAHLFVTLLDEGRSAIDKSIHLTQLMSAITPACDSVGIMWGPSSQVHEPVAFGQMAEKMTTEDLPLHLWVDFRVIHTDDGLGLFTTGLAPLGHEEIEVRDYNGPPQELVGAVYNIAHYMLEKKATLREGETIGLPGGAQITVHQQTSMIDPSQEVIQLEFSAA